MSTIDALNIFIKTPVNNHMLHALVNSTLKAVPQAVIPSSQANPELPSLFTFINRLVKHTNVYTGTLMATMVYLKRVNEKLPSNAIFDVSTGRHRLFLACLILSSKFHNDASPKNKHWAKYTNGLFCVEDINLMERQLLCIFDWDVNVSLYDLDIVLKEFLQPIKMELKNVMRLNTFINKNVYHNNNHNNVQRQSPPQCQLPPSPVSIYSNSSNSSSNSNSYNNNKRIISRSHSTNSDFQSNNNPHKKLSNLRKYPSLPHLNTAISINYSSNAPLSASSSTSSYKSGNYNLNRKQYYEENYSSSAYSSNASSTNSSSINSPIDEIFLKTPQNNYQYYSKNHHMIPNNSINQNRKVYNNNNNNNIAMITEYDYVNY